LVAGGSSADDQEQATRVSDPASSVLPSPSPRSPPTFFERPLAVAVLQHGSKGGGGGGGSGQAAAGGGAGAEDQQQQQHEDDDQHPPTPSAGAAASAAASPPAAHPLLGLAPAHHDVASRAVPGKGEDKWLLAPHNVFALLPEEEKGGQGDDNTTTLPSCSFSAYGIFDGHGGKAASAFAARHLLPHVARAAERCGAIEGVGSGGGGKDGGSDPAADAPDHVPFAQRAQDALAAALPWALRQGFLSADEECRRRFPTGSGSTATLAVQCGFLLAVASVGDSHAFLDTGKEVVQMSGNHRLEDSLQERKRVVAEGGE